jgi:phytanoyl-CoA hydroxylase
MMKNQSAIAFDDAPQEDHAPDLYAEIGVAEPIQTFDAFDDNAEARYFRDGFLAIENAFTASEAKEALEGMDDLVMGRREGYDGILFESKARDLGPELLLENRLDAIRKFWRFTEHEPRLKQLAYHPKLIQILQRILKESPVMFQDMALVKPPKIGREKPWHQDHAYFDFPLGTRIVGVWIALDEATVENGCMRVLSGAQHEGARLHFKKRDWQLCDAEMAGCKPLAVPLRPGGLLLFDALLPHGTPTNHSPKRRRALQFHYHNSSAKKGTAEERLLIFGSEGKNVTC